MILISLKTMNELKTGPDTSSKTAGVPITTTAHLSPFDIAINRILVGRRDFVSSQSNQ